MRTRSRDKELAFGLIGYSLLGLLVAGCAVGFYFGTVASIQLGQPWIITAFLWAVLLIWQLAPILFEGFSPGVNFQEIARYPISFRAYYLLNCFYGLADPAALTALLWLAAIWMGIASVRPEWGLLVIIPFFALVLLNLFCNRIVVGLFERFQSSRKGRERMVVVLLLIMLAPQLFQILIYNWTRVSGAIPAKRLLGFFTPINRISPPGLVMESLSLRGIQMLWPFLLLLIYCGILALLLRMQARMVYLGEIYSEAHAAHHELKVQPGWSFPGLDDPVVAIMGKELRYIRQNSRLLVQLASPIVFALLFFLTRGPAGSVFRKGGAPGLLAIIAGLLLLNVSNVGYNLFGMDQEGFGRWLLSPISLQRIIAAKNLANGVLFLALYLMVAVATLVTARISALSLATVTTGFLALLLVQFCVGNMVSAYWPRKIDLTRMTSRMASNAAGWASLMVLLPVAVFVGGTIYAATYWELPWLPLAVAAGSLVVASRAYFYYLGKAAGYLNDHLEEVEDALTR